jgi:hypothetical protein
MSAMRSPRWLKFEMYLCIVARVFLANAYFFDRAIHKLATTRPTRAGPCISIQPCYMLFAQYAY